jgi:hypothetical protein
MNGKHSSILPHFRGTALAPDDRRMSARYTPVNGRILLIWSDDKKLREFPSLVLNLSQTGALVSVRKPPPINQVVRIRLEGDTVDHDLDGLVVGLIKSLLGTPKVRIAFSTPCDYDFFKTVVYGNEVFGKIPPRH